jgi:CheY-like chemotaxis protein
VVVLTADPAFEESVRTTFGGSPQIGLDVIQGKLPAAGSIALDDATVVVADIDAGDAAELAALEHMMARVGNWPPVIVITQCFEESVARSLMQMRVADFLVKPVSPVDLVRACARVAKAPAAGDETTEAQIFTFLPAVGGAGVTTLAVQTAMLLLNSGRPRFPARRLRRLSRHRAPLEFERDRAAPGTARPAIARNHAVAASVGSGGDRCAQSAGGNAFVRSRHGHAAPRSRVVAFRLCGIRHAAHLVLLDR